ncbi:hypothetical protein [Allomuricauda sp. F6463D]|uniref:hypothetical protein n=1 Tax=Allomuricauda sp. F6463D TaxID=2926409 RepID=UPI001FF35AC4|nr:hypothetical protein [Muricauda sp. F6463D]MCK0159091.1 hypothetical protein [Muricauda sp. F6463D]
MRTSVKFPFALPVTFLWIGFIGAISFMEAWLKFQAPGITIPLGLGIGQLVFSALNKVEWVFALVILGNFILWKDHYSLSRNKLYPMVLTLLILQTLWLLPALNSRVELLLQGQKVENSYLHLYYVGMELIKVISLFLLAIKLLKK